VDRYDGRVARLAARQRGCVTRSQLRAVGLADGAVAHRVAVGRLHRLFRGVYLVGHPVPPALAWETAALLATGPTAVISHLTAAALWGIAERPDEVHVTVSGRRCRRQQKLRPHAGTLTPQEIRRREGLPVTSPERTLKDLSSFLDRPALERITNEAEVSRLVRPRHDALPTRNKAERRLTDLLAKAGLRPTDTNARVAGWEVDALWADLKVVVELDGYAFHRTRRAFERDRRKDQELTASGYRVLRITWRQLDQEPERLIATIAAAVA
jgi:very-short-patch-repair endonuclease